MIKLSEYRKQFKSDYALAKSLGKSQTAITNWLRGGAYIDLCKGEIYIKSANVNVEGIDDYKAGK